PISATCSVGSFISIPTVLCYPTLVATGMTRRFARHRVHQRLLDLVLAEVRRRDGTGDTATVPCTVISDHVGRADQPCRFQRHQLGIAGSQPDSVQRCGTHSTSLAIAFSAATAMALPPLRPCTTR